MTTTTLDTKKMAKLSLEEGRKRQSPLTGFLHYTFENHSLRDGIPIYENLVFILALCRSNQADLILEGRDLFLKLRHFFSDEGGFGTYLHEWPKVRKPLANVRCLFPLLHLWLEYRHVIGDEARGELDKTLDSLSRLVDSLELPAMLKFQKEVFDSVYSDKRVPKLDPAICQSSKDWSEVIVVAPFLDEAIEWPWHRELKIFGGAYLHELKRTTLFDLYHGAGCREDEIAPLYGALIYDFECVSKVPEVVETRAGVWENRMIGDNSFAFLRGYEPNQERISPGFHLWHITTERTSLVCQEGRMSYCGKLDGEVFVSEYEFGEISELNLFLDYVPKECLCVNGVPATFFELGDKLSIMGLTVEFEKVSGEGRLCGHFLRGNRNSQTCPKIKSDWEAYDWQINLTALKQESDLRIRVKISAD